LDRIKILTDKFAYDLELDRNGINFQDEEIKNQISLAMKERKVISYSMRTDHA
jgi:hypothetical protein